MPRRARTFLPLLAVAVSGALAPLAAQQSYPDPWTVADSAFGHLPAGRAWGSTSAIYPAPDGRSVWVAERCGANTCIGSKVDPILQLDLSGRVLRSFGAGMFDWPHGMFVDPSGNVWVADAVGYDTDPAGKGHVVYEFSPDGRLLRTLGVPGVGGEGPDVFNKPSDVLVAPDGSIFVADGHDHGGNNRIVKLDRNGRFIKAWGTTGMGEGEFVEPHALAMDSRGRLFVGDRGNSRIQIFDQEGNYLATYTQFGRPSGLFIKNDTLYSADSESNQANHPGWRRGIYVGDALTGFVYAFVPDPEPDPLHVSTSAAEGVAVDAEGNLYGAEVGPHTVRKYVRKKN